MRIGEDIRSMKIRGAGRIARAAADALRKAAQLYTGGDLNEFMRYMERVASYLVSTRPTAVSLPNAVMYVMNRLRGAYNETSSVKELKTIVVEAAEEFIEYSLKAVERIGEIGSRRIRDGDTVLTHCNSSAAISVILHAHRQGKNIRVYATETRPLYQGYITAKTLAKEGVPVTLIPDSTVRHIMKRVDKVVVGADTVAANGAVVNKIGTSQIALAAHEARVWFLVAAETYKFSPATILGELVVIEERSPLEVVDRDYLEKNPNVKVLNPAFDITPPQYIDAIITERGLIPPQAAVMILRDLFGWPIQEHDIKGFEESEPLD